MFFGPTATCPRLRRFAAGTLGLWTVAFCLSGQGQTTAYFVDAFNPSGTGGHSYVSGQIGSVWANWFGGAFQSLTWDAASDASNNAASGSMKISLNFSGGNNQFAVYDGMNGISPPLNGLQYTNFQCDVRFDAASAKVTVGGVPIFGHLEFGTRNGSSQLYFGSVDIPASNTNWVHVSFKLNPIANPNLLNIYDVLIHIYGPFYSPGLSGTSILWVDNIKFIGAAPASTNCVVDWNDVHQRIDGFGASSAWRSSWSVAQADMFFSTNTGIGLSLLRNRIAPDGTTVETGIMQMARDRGARVWSSPWSPPVAYKDSGSLNGGNFRGGAATNQAYATQLANYVLSMKNTYGINLYAISIQNEPDFNTTSYESCVWNSQQMHDFIPYLATALSNNGVASTKILLAESQNWRFDLTTNAIKDAATSNLFGIMAAHPYDYSVAPANRYDKALWETEFSTFDAYDGGISNAMYWASQIHSFMTYAEVNAWHFWWLIASGSSNEGLTDSSGNPAKRMYALGNYSRFVRPGFYRVGVSNNAYTLVSAYKDPASASFAIVAVNTGGTTVTQTFVLKSFTAGTVTPWMTSSNQSLVAQPVIVVNGSSFASPIPALSVVTFVGQANLPPTLSSVANQTVNAGVTLTLTNLASDPNAPPQALAFSLLSAPGSAAINPASGVFTWRPPVASAGTTNSVVVQVADNGAPILTATNNFKVMVNPLARPVVDSITIVGGQVRLSVNGPSGPDYTLLTSTNLVNWQALLTTNAPVLPVEFLTGDLNADFARFYRIQLGP